MITLTVITACFSEYKYSEALYSSGSDVTVHWSLHWFSAAKKDSVNSISSKYQLRKPAKLHVFFNTTVMVLFVSFPQKRNGIVFSSGVNYLHSGGNIQSE